VGGRRKLIPLVAGMPLALSHFSQPFLEEPRWHHGGDIVQHQHSVEAQRVTLEGFNDCRQLRVPMRRKAGIWTVCLKLSAGWFFYHFNVDGKTHQDREAGKCKTADGRPYSLALIQNPIPSRPIRYN